MSAEIRQLQSLQDWPVDMGHLSTIFVLDHDHNGRVTLQVRSPRHASTFPARVCLTISPPWNMDPNDWLARARQELLDFATICSVKADEFRHREFPMMIQGFCTLQMYDMTVALGSEYFVRWFALLFSESEAETVCENEMRAQTHAHVLCMQMRPRPTSDRDPWHCIACLLFPESGVPGVSWRVFCIT